ncbi:MAG: aminotransferase class I/II-fold pyridoxal phosphate-dependent enzyme [Candidatus Eremiobacteraeota bacterium]|nr:aminotransferase class I/II-fold pyridoxal phosphate-dependent enzyme [Candidatus Eremiobacteraeota bacterium]MBV8582590.1 aminotransferase class I/II-fold pyridoxal phosphate-dependent enzyme [Candidatus Eremiobacteraeota bacterium]MBV8655752.1 aminotransferase class I/II-fold pyridoxal phosphate-dependent enzyme [Candidatus Eremiobacteraeota bacterium]
MSRPETLAVHAGRGIDPATGALTLPLHLSTTFERDPDGRYTRGYHYSREGNPVRDALERCLAELEGGAEAMAFPSGMAAAFGVLQTLRPGDRIVCARDTYFGVRDLLIDYFPQWGIDAEFVDANDARALHASCTPPTKLVWVETPSNPLIEIIDIAVAAEVAHGAGALLVAENTFATPAVQRPFEHGADIVVHSVTKYLSGHSDVLAGAVVFKEGNECRRRVRDFQLFAGSVLDPFDAWLTLRGIATLPLRMRAHCDNALAVARFLRDHPAVARVYYPGLEDDAGHAVAKKQMRGFGGMLSFEIRGGRDEAFAMLARLKLIARATSLGGTHSLIEHRASIEGAHTRAPESLIRLSAGIEHPDDIVADLQQALA